MLSDCPFSFADMLPILGKRGRFLSSFLGLVKARGHRTFTHVPVHSLVGCYRYFAITPSASALAPLMCSLCNCPLPFGSIGWSNRAATRRKVRFRLDSGEVDSPDVGRLWLWPFVRGEYAARIPFAVNTVQPHLQGSRTLPR